jgi:hypothetical protein
MATDPEHILIIGFDAEWTLDPVNQRNHILSYQYFGRTASGTWSGIIYTESGDPVDRIEFKELLGKAIEHGRQEGHLPRTWPTEVYAAAHFSRGDLSAFRDFDKLYSQFDGIRGTFTSLTSSYDTNYYDASKNKHPLKIRLVDTQLLTPGNKGLASLGDMYGLPKLSLPPGMIEHMDVLLREDKPLFEDYAIRDAELACLHAWRMIEFGKEEMGIAKPSSSLGSLSVKHVLKIWEENEIELCDVLGKEKHISSYYNPKTRRKHTRPNMVSIRAVSDEETFVTECYHGGRNEAYVFGPSVVGVWNDYDLAGAYTTAMVAFRVPDYEAQRPTTDLNDFQIDVMGFARIRFKFPDNTRFPCLPVRYEAGLIFPLEGTTYVASPEIRLALDMGAEIIIEKGLVVPWKSEVRPFELFAKSIRDKRDSHEKGSVEEQIWKEIGNSLYGKLAQGLKERRIYDPRTSSSKRLPPSKVTQAYLAAYTTSLIRAVLGELLHRIPPEYTVISATTDGFITNSPTIDQSGPLCQMFFDLRGRISDDPAILEGKHGAFSVLSIKTRGQVVILSDGGNPIIAKAGVKVPFDVVNEGVRRLEEWPEEGFSGHEDKPSKFLTDQHHADWFLHQFLSRTPETVFKRSSLVSMREMIDKGSDLVENNGEIAMNLEYDWKRELINPEDREVPVWVPSGIRHIFAESRPWRSLKEFTETRLLFDQWRKRESNVLKTMEDWESWEEFKRTALVSKRGIRRDKSGLAGQAKKLILKAFARGVWGLQLGTYREFSTLLTEAGYPTNMDALKNAKRSAVALEEGLIPVDEEVIKLVKVILDVYPEFEWWRLFDDLESELLEELTVRGKAAE